MQKYRATQKDDPLSIQKQRFYLLGRIRFVLSIRLQDDGDTAQNQEDHRRQIVLPHPGLVEEAHGEEE